MARTKQLARKTPAKGPTRRSSRNDTPSKSGTKNPKSKGTKGTPKSGEDEGRTLRVKRRAKRGVKALKEIRVFQKTVDLLIPKRPFYRIVKEIMQNVGSEAHKIRPDALEALQEAGEAFLVGRLEDANASAIHAKRVTIMLKDMQLAQRLSTGRAY
ncbi:centromere specific histone H3 variant [Dunaliella salina]|uniref:Centromere specific histone H3 variant n=1 Tax=Dunaliella salina TaxID=3046 RepID=A0ABQ7GR49_DUNSA|nr:centromere specific histone H3 variant [Dunaliella salina]|eukprot:KAF5837084.1 centromere specific histone H3 variant [Dunaliella salina]